MKNYTTGWLISLKPILQIKTICIRRKILLTKAARKVQGEEQDVHDTGSEFQSTMDNGKKD